MPSISIFCPFLCFWWYRLWCWRSIDLISEWHCWNFYLRCCCKGNCPLRESGECLTDRRPYRTGFLLFGCFQWLREGDSGDCRNGESLFLDGWWQSIRWQVFGKGRRNNWDHLCCICLWIWSVSCYIWEGLVWLWARWGEGMTRMRCEERRGACCALIVA